MSCLVWCFACSTLPPTAKQDKSQTELLTVLLAGLFAFVYGKLQLLFHSVEHKSYDIGLHMINFTFQRDIQKWCNFTVSALKWPPPYDLYEQAAVC